MDTIVIRNIITIILKRRWIDWQDPNAIDPQIFDVIQFTDQARDITDAIFVRIVKGSDVDLIENDIHIPWHVSVIHQISRFNE